jgi:hypothetical protein
VTSQAERRLLLGVSLYAAVGVAGGRQARALDALRRLTRAELVNVQWRDGAFAVPGIRTLAVLERSSTVTGRPGPLKPLVPEILDALAAEAGAHGLEHVCLANADIAVTQPAVDLILDGGSEGCAFSRLDVDGLSGRPLGVQVHGIDAFAVTCSWWRANRARFRDYVLGEPTWDNVFSAILLSHASARIENREGLIRHERHDSAWRESPYAQYTRLLAARDAWYFSRWCEYLDRLMRQRAAGAAQGEEAAIARQVFSRRPTLFQRAVQATRSAKALVRYNGLSRRRG